jgi:peptide/nickel transport system permease protein
MSSLCIPEFIALIKDGVLAIAGVSAPAFWLAMILQLVSFRELGWLPLSGRISNVIAINHPVTPITGMVGLDALLTGNWPAFRNAAAHLVLPAATLAAYPLGLTIRMTRASMGEALGERYVLAATALGLGRRTVLVDYALRNALAPTLTLVGLCFAFALTGAFLVEIVFSWPGLGRYVAEAILAVDFPVIMAVTLIVTAVYVVVNLLVDLAQAWLDPRVLAR